jgi:16S rRNA (guanine966-N2)-methyltransferase
MSMRVISGTAKGRKLKMVPGDTTRPVRDIVKESLFNILGTWIRGTRWLDLFAGTGSVGIEALSRGAGYCLFLDSNWAAVKTVRENLLATDLADLGDAQRADSFGFLATPSDSDQQFDVIYIAPPQYKGMWCRALELIDADPSWLHGDGMVIVQIDPSEDEQVPLSALSRYDERKYGKTLLVFYELLPE